MLAGLLLGGREVCACGLACGVGAGAVLAAGVERHFSQGAAARCGPAARGCWPQAARGQAERLARLLRAEGQARQEGAVWRWTGCGLLGSG